jgi:hypothetical protein
MSTQEQNAWMRQVLNILIPSANPAPSSAPGPASARAADGLPADLPAQNTTVDPSQPAKDAPKAALPEGAQEVRDMIDDLEATMKQLLADGVPAEMLDATKISKFRGRYDAAIKPAASANQVRAQTAALKQLKVAVATAAKDLKADADRQTTALGSGAIAAIKDLRDAASKLIDAMVVKDAKDPKDPKTVLAARLRALTDEIPDPAKIADKATLEAALKKADSDAKALLKDAAKAGGDTDPKVRQAVQDAYQKAIKEKYGISFGEGPDQKLAVKDTRLDDFYEVLEKVPVGHVAHKNMRDLSYVRGLDGIGKYTGVGIEMGTMSRDDDRRAETDPKDQKTTQENKFAITVLHELGHSVDARWDLMPGIQHDAKCGGWIAHDWNDLAGRLISDFQGSHARVRVTEEQLHAAAQAALIHGADAPAPDGVDPALWAEVAGHFHPWAEMHARSYPWVGDPVSYKDRSYVFGKWAGAQWFSYLPSARSQMHITNYQWSSPREWFAELYALCWHKNEPAPSFVHEKVQAFMPGGAAAAAAAPKKS